MCYNGQDFHSPQIEKFPKASLKLIKVSDGYSLDIIISVHIGSDIIESVPRMSYPLSKNYIKRFSPDICKVSSNEEKFSFDCLSCSSLLLVLIRIF